MALLKFFRVSLSLPRVTGVHGEWQPCPGLRALSATGCFPGLAASRCPGAGGRGAGAAGAAVGHLDVSLGLPPDPQLLSAHKQRRPGHRAFRAHAWVPSLLVAGPFGAQPGGRGSARLLTEGMFAPSESPPARGSFVCRVFFVSELRRQQGNCREKSLFLSSVAPRKPLVFSPLRAAQGWAAGFSPFLCRRHIILFYFN